MPRLRKATTVSCIRSQFICNTFDIIIYSGCSQLVRQGNTWDMRNGNRIFFAIYPQYVINVSAIPNFLVRSLFIQKGSTFGQFYCEWQRMPTLRMFIRNSFANYSHFGGIFSKRIYCITKLALINHICCCAFYYTIMISNGFYVHNLDIIS